MECGEREPEAGAGPGAASRGADLKGFLVQEASAKDGDAAGIDNRLVPTGQGLRGFLLAVHEEGHLLLANAECKTMPPKGEEDGGKWW